MQLDLSEDRRGQGWPGGHTRGPKQVAKSPVGVSGLPVGFQPVP